MNMIFVLPKWNYKKRLNELTLLCRRFRVIDTTSGTGDYKFRSLSPFILGPCQTYLPGVYAQNFENLWQYSKVYSEHIDHACGGPSLSWIKWRNEGWANSRAVRYPMGKGRKPEYLIWGGIPMDYITARKKVYSTEYAANVMKTDSFKLLMELHKTNDLILLDYDAYDHQAMGISLMDVINNPNRKCGHAFILAMILRYEIDDCIKV